MSELRDARFQKALEAAPDAQARPAPAVAQALRAAARAALLPGASSAVALPAGQADRAGRAGPIDKARQLPWWLRLWRNSGQPRAPWNAAFASLLLGVLVTVLWVHEPIPDARTRATAAPPAVESTASPAPAPSAPEVRKAAPPVARMPPTVPTPQSAPVAAPPPVAPAAQARAQAPEPAAEPEPAPFAAAAPRAAAVPAPAAPAPLAVPPSVADSVQDSKPLAREGRAPLAAQAQSRSTAPASAVLPGLPEWTSLQLEWEGRTVTLSRVQGQAVGDLLPTLLAERIPLAAAGLPGTGGPADLRVVLQGADAQQATLSLWGNTMRWQRAGHADLVGTLKPQQLQALQHAVRQALAEADAVPH